MEEALKPWHEEKWRVSQVAYFCPSSKSSNWAWPVSDRHSDLNVWNRTEVDTVLRWSTDDRHKAFLQIGNKVDCFDTKQDTEKDLIYFYSTFSLKADQIRSNPNKMSIQTGPGYPAWIGYPSSEGESWAAARTICSLFM